MRDNSMQVHQKSAEPWQVTLVDTGEETQTGGRLKRVAPYLGDEDFCFTYGDGVADVDIDGADRVSPGAEGEGHGHRGAAARALRRAGARRQPRSRASRRSRRATAAGSTAASSCCRRAVLDYIEGDDDGLGARAAGAARARAASSRPTSTAASGSRWTRCATRTSSRSCGRAARRRGRRGDRAGVLGRQARPRHRPHRLQGQLAGAVAHVARRAGHRLRAAAADRRPVLLASCVEDDAGIVQHDRATSAISPRLRARVESRQPEIVFHLAAQSLVRRSYEDPVETFATNVHGHGAPARGRAPRRAACARSSSSRATSATRTARRDWRYRESDPLGGHDPYSSSKGCAELVTAAYRARSSRAARRSPRRAPAT